MNNISKLFLICALLFLLCSCSKNPMTSETLYIGDSCKYHRFINKKLSFAYLTNITHVNNNDETYLIKFVQYYNHNCYEFEITVQKDSELILYNISNSKHESVKINEISPTYLILSW